MKIPSNIDSVMTGKKDPVVDKVWKRFRNVYHQVQKAVNGNIEFGNPTSGAANINGRWVSVTTPAGSNTDFTVTHNLGRPVAGYWIMQSDAAADIYTSPTVNPNPNTQIILRDTGGVAHLVIFFV